MMSSELFYQVLKLSKILTGWHLIMASPLSLRKKTVDKQYVRFFKHG